MTALLEFKQKIKGLYAKYEMYLQPLMKFVLALVYFIWINSNMGYMTALDNIHSCTRKYSFFGSHLM